MKMASHRINIFGTAQMARSFLIFPLWVWVAQSIAVNAGLKIATLLDSRSAGHIKDYFYYHGQKGRFDFAHVNR